MSGRSEVGRSGAAVHVGLDGGDPSTGPGYEKPPQPEGRSGLSCCTLGAASLGRQAAGNDLVTLSRAAPSGR